MQKADADAPLATVALLAYNGLDYIEEVLDAVARQRVDGDVEVLVIDSGSTDGTLEILRGRGDIRLIEIPNSEFSHGRTRDLAVREARGNYVALLTQDATPADEHWLAELLAPFAVDERVAIVTGRQIPRRQAFPLQKYEIVTAFDQLGPRRGIVLYRPEDLPAVPAAAFHSDVNAAVRRDVARDVVPFRDVPYAEDQLMAQDVLAAGLWKAYAGAAAVLHSNDLTLSEYGRRIFDETVGLRRIGTELGVLDRRAQFILTSRGIVADTVRIARDRGMGRKARLAWLLRNPAYHVTKWRHYRQATLVDLGDEQMIARRSLEAGRRAREARERQAR